MSANPDHVAKDTYLLTLSPYSLSISAEKPVCSHIRNACKRLACTLQDAESAQCFQQHFNKAGQGTVG